MNGTSPPDLTERLRLAVRAGKVGLWDWDLRTNEVFFSPEWKRQLGYAEEEITNRFAEWESRVHPDDLAPTLAKVQALIANPVADYAVEFRMRHKDGSYRWILAQADVLRDESGQPARMLGCHLDITERKQAEAELRKAKEVAEQRAAELDRAFDVLPVGIFLVDREGAVYKANKAVNDTWEGRMEAGSVLDYAAYKGWWPESGKPLEPHDWPCAHSVMEKESSDAEIEIETFAGKRKTIRAIAAPVVDAQGNHWGAVAINWDITERKQAEAALRESEARLRLVTDHARVGLVMVSPDRHYLFANAAYAEILGLPTADIVGKRVPDVLGGVYETQIGPRLDRAFAGERVAYELQLPQPDGEHHYAVKYEPIREGDGVARVVVVIVDITERKKAEATLRESEESFHSLAEHSVQGIVLIQGEDFTYVNPAYCAITGYSAAESRALTFAQRLELVHPEDRAQVIERQARFARGEPIEESSEVRIIGKDGRQRWVLASSKSFLLRGRPARLGMMVDITERKQAEALLAGQNLVLERIAGGAPLAETLAALIKVIEGQSPGLLGSVLLLQPDGVHVRHGAAPSLPEEFTRAVDGQPIGPRAGSCGTSLFRRAPVIVEDILTDELWTDYRALAAAHGLRACWATPIFDAQGRVLGSFACYFRAPGRPGAGDLRLIEAATHIASIAITKAHELAALRESEERLRLFAEQAPAPIAMLDENLNFLAASSRWLSGHGWQDRNLIGRHMYEEFPDVPERWKEIHRRCLSGAVESSEADPWVRADGSTNWVRWEMRPWRKRDGVIGGLVVFSEDITANRQMELRLHEGATRLSLAVAASNVGLWDWNLLTNEVFFSKEWKSQLGYAEDEIANRFEEWQSRVHPDDVAATLAKVQAFIANPEAGYAVEFRLRHKDGSYRWIFTQGQLIRDEAGQPVRMLGCHLDITERKQAEQELRLQAAAVAAAANEVVITDRAGTIQWVNPAFTKATGYTLEEAVGQNPSLLKSGKHDSAFYENLWATILRGEVWRGEMVNRKKDGSLFTEEAIIAPVKDERGEITHFVAIKQDITEKKLLEAKFLRAQRLEGLGALAGGVAHDLNNVLAPILMASEFLRMQASDTHSREMLDMIKSSTQRGAGMIRQILSFARGTAGEKIVLQVAHLLKDISQMVKDTFPAGIQCELRVASGLPAVLGDATGLYQVLLNLCINARDAMAGSGKITLTAERILLDETYARLSHEARPGHYVVLTVADTGGGIPKEIQEKIFEPFYTTKEPGKGTGLGLATVKDIVTGHGGFIHLYSEMGVGTQFKIYLPAAEGEEAAAEPTLLTLPGGHGELVLLVDDEAAVREIVKATLEGYGYRVVTAEDGTQAVARFVEHMKEVQLLLTDMQMPHMDGAATIRALRNIQPSLRVIAASGLNTHEAALKATGLEVQGFIPKPFTAASLLLALDAALHPK